MSRLGPVAMDQDGFVYILQCIGSHHKVWKINAKHETLDCFEIVATLAPECGYLCRFPNLAVSSGDPHPCAYLLDRSAPERLLLRLE